MSDTGITLSILGVDRTANAFRAVAARATMSLSTFTRMGETLGKVFRIAIPSVAFYKLAQGAANAVRELSLLSDRAADASTTTPMIMKLSGAMAELGVRGASVDTLSRAMQKMAQTTGQVGAEGLARVLGQASQLGTEAERLQFLVQAFGREAGASFASLVREGPDALRDKLVGVAESFPAVTDAAAQAGDRAADAMARIGAAAHAGWMQIVGDVVSSVETVWGPLPEFASDIASGVCIAFKSALDTVRIVAASIRGTLDFVMMSAAVSASAISHLYEAATKRGYGFGDAWDDIRRDAANEWKTFTDLLSAESDGLDDVFDFSNIGAAAETKPILDKMRDAIGQGGVTFIANAAQSAAAVISNAFSKGAAFALKGSNEARKIIAGSQPGNAGDASRTVARTLPGIAADLARIADSTASSAAFFAELEAI